MWAQGRFKHLLPTLVPAANTGLSQKESQPPSQISPQKPMLGGGGGGGHNTNFFQLDAPSLQAVLRKVADKGFSRST